MIDGLLGSRARKVITQGRGAREQINEFEPLHQLFWMHVGDWNEQLFWQTGSQEIWLQRGEARCSVHGLKFDPIALESLLADIPATVLAHHGPTTLAAPGAKIPPPPLGIPDAPAPSNKTLAPPGAKISSPPPSLPDAPAPSNKTLAPSGAKIPPSPPGVPDAPAPPNKTLAPPGAKIPPPPPGVPDTLAPPGEPLAAPGAKIPPPPPGVPDAPVPPNKTLAPKIPLPPLGVSDAPASPNKQAGSAPAKLNWELVMAEVAARLYLGDFKPEKQADIEQTMTEIATTFVDEIGEATIRRHAKLLWDKIKSGP